MPTHLAHDAVDAWVLAEAQFHLVMAVVHLEDTGPSGPGVVCSTLGGRGRQDLKCGDALSSLWTNHNNSKLLF